VEELDDNTGVNDKKMGGHEEEKERKKGPE